MASIKILQRDKPNSEGLCPVALRITKDRKNKYITLGVKCLKKDWDEKSSQFKKSYPNYLQRNRVLLKLKERALKIIDDFYMDEIDFTLNQFEEKFRGKDRRKVTVFEFWDEKISNMVESGRIGNSRAYAETKKSFFKFCKNPKIVFKDITVEILDRYEAFLRSSGGTDGGIGLRMREIRALYNDAIKKGVVDEKYYPFKLYKVSKLKGKGIKKALTREEVKLIETLDELKYPHLVESKHLFVFSYYTRGMNFYDVMKLTWNNIVDDKIVYTRSKTKGRFVIKILKPVEEILNYYKKENPSLNYVFPIILRDGLTPIQLDNRKAKKLKKFNTDLRKIAEIVGIDKPVTSYVARHSYATNLKQLGVSTDVISQSMGHQNIAITSAYLKEFENDVIDDANDKLLMEPIPHYYLTNSMIA